MAVDDDEYVNQRLNALAESEAHWLRPPWTQEERAALRADLANALRYFRNSMPSAAAQKSIRGILVDAIRNPDKPWY